MATEIILNDRNKVVIQKSAFKGQDRVDIRHWFRESDDDNWKPTKKGVNLPFDDVIGRELVEGIQQAFDLVLA